MKDSIFNYLSVFTFGGAFIYLTLGHIKLGLIMVVLALICIPLSILFKKK